ncbi:hypothetical protein TNCV_519741 [Trichonephila clavipes]|nr:hypothetical protein TNCV_519741 [Trichonephila clavipes]
MISRDMVKLCGHNKNISFPNEDCVCRQDKAMRQHLRQGRFLKTGPLRLRLKYFLTFYKIVDDETPKTPD